MKELVILTGGSGIGKTTSFLPALKEHGYTPIETGDLFKSIIGSIRDGGFGLEDWFYDSDALDSYIRQLPGKSTYETDWKVNVGDVQSCYAFELLRCVAPDFHVRSVFTIADAFRAERVVTSCINQDELEILIAVSYEQGWEPTVVRLDCTNPSRKQVRREPVVTEDMVPHVYTIDVAYALEAESIAAAIEQLLYKLK